MIQAACDNRPMARSSAHFRRLRRPGLLALIVLLGACGGASPSTPAPSATHSLYPIVQPSIPYPVTPAPDPGEPIVPVAGFRTQATSIDRAGVLAALAGTNQTFGQLELVAADSDAVLAALGIAGPPSSDRLVLAATSEALSADLHSYPKRLGLMRASDVGPSVHALAYEGRSLFGVDRIADVSEWPLRAALDGPRFDPASTWTIAAAGDVMLDRGVYKVLKLDGKGADFPFDGGTATITSRYCCSSFGWAVPRAKRLDTSPQVRHLVSGADLAVVNLEGPAPVNARYHSGGMTFTFDQSLLVGLQNAGIDVVSLANNHIGNAGRQGIRDTVAVLDKMRIEHMGAGIDRAGALAPACFTIDGVKVAILGYSAFSSSYAAGPSLAGVAELSWGTAPADIKAARDAGAQVVIVYPHWGTEYKTGPTAAQRTWAHRFIDAGADLVIGNHAHWAGAMEVYKGKPIWYALGNFVFDQTWSEETEEGLILELTFSGPNLIQAWLHPTLILDSAQPNFLDAASAGVVFNRVYGSSKYLPW
jgi:poly-gamma-glutamate capsule biosynthesis protein CapA/YwtB (metallophosphatase superfamily)